MAKIWYLGHSCFQLEIDDVRIVVDPFITDNPLAKNIKISDIQADIILVTHGHGDHIGDLVHLANQTGALVVCNYEIYVWLEKQGYTNARPMNHGGCFSSRGIDYKVVNAVHSSSFPDGSYAGNAMGFVIEGQHDCVYYAGDTALTLDMKLIGEAYELTAAFLPIGDNFTMGAKDAALAATFCKTKKVIGMHFDTFEMIEIDHEEAKNAFREKGVELILPEVGQILNI